MTLKTVSRPTRFATQQCLVGLLVATAILCTPGRAVAQKLTQQSDGLSGYISVDVSQPPPEFRYGVSFYITVWRFIDKPMDSFQIGLPSQWIMPYNADYQECLCPAGSVAQKEMKERGPTYRDVFQTIEGGLGYWQNTRYGSVVPKYRMNGTGNCYNHMISTPGWGFDGENTEALAADKMGLAQLSNRLLTAPDGFTFKNVIDGELLGNAWMAMPLTEPKGYFRLQPKSREAENFCLEGNEVKPGATFDGASLLMKSADVSGQKWKLMADENGYFRLQTAALEGKSQCLDGNTGKGAASLGGAVHMAASVKAPAQHWKMIPAANGYFRLQCKSLEKSDKCLEAQAIGPDKSPRGTALMAKIANSDNQLWKLVPVTSGDKTPTGDLCWTLFFNARNFKGPVAFWIPQTWSDIYRSSPPSVGRGLDSLTGAMAGGAMEINTVPYFEGKDARGVKYTRIPKLLFPVNAQGTTVLMQDVLMHSSAALYDPLRTWLNDGGDVSLRFTKNTASAPICTTGEVDYTHGPKKLKITGIENTVKTRTIPELGAAYGLQWGTVGTKGVFPEYFKHAGTKLVAVTVDQVPDETHLKTQQFTPATRGISYKSPKKPKSVWTTPGAAAGPFTAALTDGSVVTYSWYRFVDQPSLQHLNMNEREKSRLQSRVEKLHAASADLHREYMPAQSAGKLVKLDDALIVTPPKGLEVGYVPIAIGQAAK